MTINPQFYLPIASFVIHSAVAMGLPLLAPKLILAQATKLYVVPVGPSVII